jgi:hypothetical protein
MPEDGVPIFYPNLTSKFFSKSNGRKIKAARFKFFPTNLMQYFESIPSSACTLSIIMTERGFS